jgi:hypothetical protein
MGKGGDAHAQLAKNVVIRLERVRIPSQRTLYNCQSQTPDVTLHTIAPATSRMARRIY